MYPLALFYDPALSTTKTTITPVTITLTGV